MAMSDNAKVTNVNEPVCSYASDKMRGSKIPMFSEEAQELANEAGLLLAKVQKLCDRAYGFRLTGDEEYIVDCVEDALGSARTAHDSLIEAAKEAKARKK